MKAWRFYGTGQPMKLEEVEEPHAGPDEVVVDVKAAGLCHSDVSALDDPGWMDLFPRIPMTMGHENAGVIIEVGANMGARWKVGDRVGLSPMMPDRDAIGYGMWDGGFGPQIRATDANLVKLPDEVAFDLGAMATDAGLTSYHAMVAVGGAKAGMRIGVIGLGGLGYIGARVASLLGAEVYGAEVNPTTRDLADEIGLTGVAESITAFADKQLELIVDYAGFGTTTAAAIETLGEFGTLVQVGMGKLESHINTYPIIINQLTIRGSRSGTLEDMAALYELMRAGQLNPPMNKITQAEIPESLDKLRAGGVVGRLIAMYN
ncbi:MAG: alcohol dehydrogenase catalytic domain-containing protein [Propionibacteriaceae bacterium]|nr:alcohol dehydrogenase catalytic domain-containing protein [Propionibacteriaceae bacterium]